MKHLEGYPVFLEPLRDQYERLREDFGESVDHLLEVMSHQPEDFVSISRVELFDTFDSHFHRFQQVYVMLRHLNMLHDPDTWEVTMTTTPLKSESVIGTDMLVPLIRQYPFATPLLGVRKETVEFLKLPKGGFEVCTVASLPISGMDVDTGFLNQTVLLTTNEVWTESMLVSQSASEISFVWGEALIDSVVGGLKAPDRMSLN